MLIETLNDRGFGRTTDGTLFARTIPGEEVDAEGTVLVPSEHRVAPPCPHFSRCGACALQHASDPFVAGWKADRVREILARAGLEAEIAGVETSPPGSRRRAKLSGRRTKKSALVGFHAYHSDTIIEVPDCRVMTPALVALLPALVTLTRLGASRKGELDMTVTDTANGADLFVDGGKELTGQLRIDLANFAAEAGLSRLTWGQEPVVTRLPPVQTFGKAEVAPPPGAFLQATKHGEEALLRSVRDGIGDARQVVDLFAGCGTFSLPLAERAEVHAVETYAPMLAALDRGWRHTHGLKRVTTETRDLFRNPLMPDELKRFDAAVIDPPRQGAKAQVVEVAASALTRVAMVSCNPATFAADARSLVEAGFTMGPVTVTDQFRWSPHIELACNFTRL